MIFNSKMNEAQRLAELLKVDKNSVVADVGAGKGDFTLALAEKAGMVFAVEFDAGRLATVKKRVEKRGLDNIKLIQSTETSANLPPQSCDAIFLRGVYHHLSDPAAMNASIISSLKPGGLLAIIDFPPGFFISLFSPVKDVPKNRGGHGIRKQIVIQELTDTGLKLVKEIDPWISGRYCLLFIK